MNMADENERTIVDEIEEMINPKESTDAPATEVPGTDAPSTNAPSTDAPATEAPSTSAPATDAPSTDSPTTDAPEEESAEDILRRENDELRAKLAEKDAPKTPATQPPLEIEDVDFIEKYGIDMDDPKTLNTALNALFKDAVAKSKSVTVEEVYKGLPDIVKHNIGVHTALAAMTKKFYADNEDLIPFKQSVAVIAEEIIAKNPDWKLEEVFNETEKVSRARLNLKKQIQKQERGQKKDPKFAKTPGGRKGPTKKKPEVTNSMQAQIDQMNNI
jgi:hypothetical protein